jgi:glycyl-tRNA synthetase beta chain
MKLDNLLIELLVEELPPKALKKIGEAFKEVITHSLKDQGLLIDKSRSTGFATPRRLGVLITDVLSRAPDKQILQKIMPVSVALNDQGQATPALTKKLQSLGLAGLEIGEMRREMDGKSETLFCDRLQPGIELEAGLQVSLNLMLSKLPIPKVMSYQLDKGCEMPGWSTGQVFCRSKFWDWTPVNLQRDTDLRASIPSSQLIMQTITNGS